MDAYGRNRLPYPYSYTTRDVFPNGITVPIDVQPVRNDCNLVILELSDADLLKLSSAMQAGLDLIYPDDWQTLYDLWAYASALANTGKYVTCDGLSIVSICQIIADCLSDPQSPAFEAVTELILESGGGNPANVSPLPALGPANALDCVWGASVGAYEIVLDVWANVKGIVEGAADLAESLAGVKGLFGPLTPAQVEFLEALNSSTIAQMDAYLNQQSTQDGWACALFNCIRIAGMPYEITNSCLDGAFDVLNAPSPLDVFGIGDVLGFSSDYSTIKSYWQRISDDECNNDWETVCGLVCGPALPDIVSWTDPRIAQITPSPTILSGGKTAVWSFPYSPIEILFTDAFCVNAIDVLLQRPVGQTLPSEFSLRVGGGVPVLETVGGFTEGDLAASFGGQVGQVLRIENEDFPSNSQNLRLTFDDPGKALTISQAI